ncbi:MAG: DUF975 family protein [Lachnospiraceae bacterium]|nr:DUF975 family protein [Lachnospiraceae bacterium]
MWTRVELKEKAKNAFSRNYWWCVLAGLIMSLILGGSGGGGGSIASTSSSSTSSSVESEMSLADIFAIIVIAVIIAAIIFIVVFAIATVIATFVTNVLEVGGCKFFLENSVAPANVKHFGYGFANNYKNVVNVMFFRYIYTFLWSLLFIIPGIIKSYEYRMIPYLLAENPDMTKDEAFALSKRMMDGNKWDAFVLDLSFIGWNLLSICTCGILSIFYVNPYIYATNAELYLALKNRINA